MPDKDLFSENQTSDSSPETTPVTEDQAAIIDELAGRVDGDYDAAQIQVLEGLEAVRKRPGMYVGDNGKRGLHQLFREVIDNSVDEALAGHCDHIKVTMFEDGSIGCEDNGRGIPVDKHPKMGVSALQVVMTVLHAGGKFGGDNSGYKTSGGLHGVGVSCTNALSEWMETTVKRNGKIYRQRFERGIPQYEVKEIGTVDDESTGTAQRWMPDSTVLTETLHNNHIITTRMRELAYLNPKVKFEFVNEIDPATSEVFFFQRGIPQLVEDLNEGKETLHNVIHFKRVLATAESDAENFEADGLWQKGSYALRKLYHDSPRPVLVVYTSPSCGPCHVLKPQLKRILNELGGAAQGVEINIEADPEIAQQAGITGTPTVQLFFQKELKHTFRGVKQRSEFKTAIEGLLN